MTPHIVRNPDITEEDLAPLWVGTENRITIFGNSPKVQSRASSEFNERAGAPGYGARCVRPAEPEVTEEPEQEVQEEEQQEPAPVQPDNRRRLTFPRPPGAGQTPQNPGQTGTPDDGNAAQSVDPPAVAELASPAAAGGSPADFPADTAQLPRLSFYPARLPVKIGGEAQLSVVLDPGVAGLSSPVHVAYDPARLRVTRVDGGELGGASRRDQGDRDAHAGARMGDALLERQPP